MGKLRTILGSFAALSLLATLGGCPKPEEKFTEFEARWCTSAENVAEAFTYCSCSTDADCG
ncbi:MAG: hypothetical protein KC731_23660, partial [Myxococcales bacterium]|nr:hypothetical protein [Myxococcales bacterium]